MSRCPQRRRRPHLTRSLRAHQPAWPVHIRRCTSTPRWSAAVSTKALTRSSIVFAPLLPEAHDSCCPSRPSLDDAISRNCTIIDQQCSADTSRWLFFTPSRSLPRADWPTSVRRGITRFWSLGQQRWPFCASSWTLGLSMDDNSRVGENAHS